MSDEKSRAKLIAENDELRAEVQRLKGATNLSREHSGFFQYFWRRHRALGFLRCLRRHRWLERAWNVGLSSWRGPVLVWPPLLDIMT